MPIEVTNRSGLEAPSEDLLSLLTFSMEELGLNSECDLNVVLVDEKEMTDLHIEWMGEDGPTDVLSFPMDELRPRTNEVGILGDIVLCPSVANTQAKEAGHSYAHELSILSAHGLLHVVGYDHANADEEKEMFDLQESLVKRWRP
jgi:probable rRNA maturation factor